MRDVAIVAFAQSPRSEDGHLETNDTETLLPVIQEVVAATGLERGAIGFTCSGSSDYLAGLPFSFVHALDAVGAWPPIEESHVEMDGAWALYEAWVRLQHGDIDTALIYGFGKGTSGSLRDVLTLQLDPYYVAPLGPDSVALAALQARLLIDSGRYSERDFADVAVRAGRGEDAAVLLDTPMIANPLRAHDVAPPSDGAAAIILAAGDKARALCERPAWIRGIDHRIDAQPLGGRDLGAARSARLARKQACASTEAFDVAEIHAPFSHQVLILKDALELGDDVAINPTGGALAHDPMMATGLIRLGEAAQAIHEGRASRALAHATSGPCLQQNLVCAMEAE